MSDKICLVCKKPIEATDGVSIGGGFVHSGVCLSFIDELPISESSEDTEELLSEVQLI